MPYDPANPPGQVRGLPSEKQRQWVHVFNSAYKKYGDEEKAHKMAWGVTGGWRPNAAKGITGPDDPDRDILLELEMEDEDFHQTIEEKIASDLGLEIELKSGASVDH